MGLEGPMGPSTQGRRSARAFPWGTGSRAGCTAGSDWHLAKGCVGWTEGPGREVLHSSDRPPHETSSPLTKDNASPVSSTSGRV